LTKLAITGDDSNGYHNGYSGSQRGSELAKIQPDKALLFRTKTETQPESPFCN
jgi:hypothetical protein